MNEIRDKVDNYIKNISKLHKENKNLTGFEKNDRAIFINDFLIEILNYKRDSVIEDVSQKLTQNSSKIPDIRLFGDSEIKNKINHSQLVIETKNYSLLNHNIDKIDFLQLKQYIISNKSKIRAICSTDYISLFIFNARKIMNDHRFRIDNVDNISETEISSFKENMVYQIHFDNLKDKDYSDIKNLSYHAVFEKHKFLDPDENIDTNSIQDVLVRNNFIRNLFVMMKRIEEDVSCDFLDILKIFIDDFNLVENNSLKDFILKSVNNEKYKLIKDYIFWGTEMNYINNFIFDPKSTIEKGDLSLFITNTKYQEAFILTSIYNLINKTFFIRILEDTSTDSIKFIKEGAKKYRYLSNGILQDKINESEEILISYLKDVYEFNKSDLKQYSFLLKKDIYSWVIEKIDGYNLLDFIRLFNDINFSKLNQDILGDIYEHYLEQDKADNEKSYRRLLGQYYTPRPIVRLMWFLVRDVLKKELNRDLYDDNKKYLDILDPAYGSGTFLYEAILQINQSAVNKEITKDGKVFGFIKKRTPDFKIENNLYGFEINPLSKSIADVNLFFGLIQAYGDNIINEKVDNLKLYRTDSFDLDYKHYDEGNGNFLFQFLADDIKYTLEERKEVIDTKKRKFDIIIANPPYGRTTSERKEDKKDSEFCFINEKNLKYLQDKIIPFAYAETHFDDFGNIINFEWDKKERQGKVPDFEKNRGKIQDMYGFFFGVADHLINDKGIICYIVSNTVLGVPSYKWFRKYLLENYKIHYVINFNKIQEDGKSMFAPEAKVATSIIVLQKGKPKKDFETSYLDLSDLSTTKEKFDHIANIKWSENPKTKNDIINFTVKSVDELNCVKVKQKDFLDNPDYELIVFSKIIDKICKNTKYLKDCGNYQLGIITSDNDKIFVSNNCNNLESQVSGFCNQNNIPFNFRKDYIKEYIRHKNLNKYNIDSIEYVYYDPSIEKEFRKIFPGFRYRYDIKLEKNDNKMEKKFKLLIGSDFFCVDDQNRILDQNCIKRRNLYFLVNDDEKILYYICAIMNSKLSKYYRDVTQIDNYEVFPIKIIEENDLFRNIVKTSILIHEVKKDYQNFKKQSSDYKTDFFNKEIKPKIKFISLLDDNDYWEVESKNSFVQNFMFDKAIIQENIIILNNDTRLIFKDKIVASIIYNDYLKSYSGNLTEKEVKINIFEVLDKDKIKEVINSIDKYIEQIESDIDNYIFELYGLKKPDIDIINEFVK